MADPWIEAHRSGCGPRGLGSSFRSIRGSVARLEIPSSSETSGWGGRRTASAEPFARSSPLGRHMTAPEVRSTLLVVTGGIIVGGPGVTLLGLESLEHVP